MSNIAKTHFNMSTTEKFVEKCQTKYGNRFDYSKTIYIGSKSKITFTCTIHNTEFTQIASDHLKKPNNCQPCLFDKKRNDFIEKAKKIHGDRYDYSKTIYTTAKTNVIIICKNGHGEFLQMPDKHANSGHGCLKCSNRYSPTLEEFIEKAKIVHNNFYNYSHIDKYINCDTKVKILCPDHGFFYQIPYSHLLKKRCSQCAGVQVSNVEEFIEKAIKIHGAGVYDYSKSKYVNCKTNLLIRCIKHDFEFTQTPNTHLRSSTGCRKCITIGYSKMQIDWLTFMEKFHNIIIQHALSGGEYRIPNTRYHVDGYCEETNTVYAFHGQYFHGAPSKYNPLDMNKLVNKTYGELYAKTIARENEIRALGYNLVIIWEYQWNSLNKSVKKLQKKFREKKLIAKLNSLRV